MEKFKANYQKEVEEMKAIAAELELASLEIHNTRPLFVRFEKAELPFALVDNHNVVILAEGEQHTYNKPEPQSVPFAMPPLPTQEERAEMKIRQAYSATGKPREEANAAFEQFRQSGQLPAWMMNLMPGVA